MDGSESGYTLLEILVVTGVIALMATIVTAHLSPGRADHVLVLQAYRLESALRTARSEALTSGRPVEFKVNVAKGSWYRSGAAEQLLPSGLSMTLYTGHSLLSGSEGVILFFPSGRSSGGHINLRSGTWSDRIDVDWLTGRVHRHANR
jgi:general secretion pathway protein H